MLRECAFKGSLVRRISLLAGLTVALAVLCGIAFSQQKSAADTRAADEKAIRETDTAFSKAASAKDLEKCMSFYADNALLLDSGAPISRGKTAIRGAFTKMFAIPGFALSWEVTKVEAARSGDLGYSLGTYVMTAKDAGGKAITTKGKYVTVWRKMADGSWKAVADIDNEDGPPAAPAPAKKK